MFLMIEHLPKLSVWFHLNLEDACIRVRVGTNNPVDNNVQIPGIMRNVPSLAARKREIGPSTELAPRWVIDL